MFSSENNGMNKKEGNAFQVIIGLSTGELIY
jgi:hypothetical protein